MLSLYKGIKRGGKKIDEHRYMMELYLGRKLDSCEVVHHINRDKRDNRLENLELMLKSAHASLHLSEEMALKGISLERRIVRAFLDIEKGKIARSACVSGTRKCYTCEAILPISRFNKNKTRPDGLHHQCKECRSVSRSKLKAAA